LHASDARRRDMRATMPRSARICQRDAMPESATLFISPRFHFAFFFFLFACFTFAGDARHAAAAMRAARLMPSALRY